MTGLTASDRDVALILDFLNTYDADGGTDAFDTEMSWHSWLTERGLDPGGGRRHARVTRDAMRSLIGDPRLTPLQPATLGVTVGIELSTGEPRLHATDAVGAVLAAASRLAVLGEWERLKICPADDCRWAFFDRSRNRSRTWCSMQVCGNREKARAWRERARSTQEDEPVVSR